MTGLQLHFLFGQFVPKCTHFIDKRFDGYHVLQFSNGGGVELTIDDETFAMQGRWWWSCYPGPRIAFKALSPGRHWVHRYVAFQGTMVDRWIADGLFPIPPTRVEKADIITEPALRFDNLLGLSRRDDEIGRRRAMLELESLLCELAETRAIRSRSNTLREPDWLTLAKGELSALGIRSVNYARFASEAGLSIRSFRREFARFTGLAPHQYVLDAKIAHARDLLARTDLPIKTVARDLGYRDIFYFTRQFKASVGVPPATYRRSREG